MARPKSFDEDKVLDAAIDCFWRNGLKSASVRDLADEMGIAGPSLYNAYGCKKELFVQALGRYAEARMRVRLAHLEAAYPPKDAILTFFAETIEDALKTSGQRGCLIANTAMEVTPQDTEIAAAVAAHLDELRAFFVRAVAAGQASGTVPPELDAEDAASLLLALLLGIRVMARTQATRERFEQAVRPVLALLDIQLSPSESRGHT
ncbi:MAG TPA: TetR/AcrR family transcriptional regulator [Hyphomicrobiales bacterium]|jgi:TetR/AcrR family transcriptional repressor of nem operon